jgi:hypothetical protein
VFNYPKHISASFTAIARHWIENAMKGALRHELPFSRTFSNIQFRHMWPLPEDICIEDIAHSLSRLCRFAGHVIPSLYSVAEHSVRVSYACKPENALWGLLHDASEAYCNDIPRPFKRSPGMEVYRLYEAGVIKQVAKKFGLDPVEPPDVKQADMALLATEQRDIVPARTIESGEAIQDGIAPLEGVIEAWTQPEAERRFLMRFYELTGQKTFYEKYKEATTTAA